MTKLVGRAMLVALAGAWFLALRPQVLGGPAAYVLVAGQSMEPTIHAGSLVVAFRKEAYDTGQVIVYRVPDGDIAAGREVIHRIVGGSADGFIVRGDNAGASDIWRPKKTDVIGTAAVVFPGVAGAIELLRSPLVVASLAAAVAAYLVMALVPTTRSAASRNALG